MAEELFGGQDVGATPSYKEQAYRLIKEAILFNRFRVGAIYSQDDICKELGISRTPVREALLELQKDGYVSFSRGKGVQVVPVSDRDARDILETRMYIECINAGGEPCCPAGPSGHAGEPGPPPGPALHQGWAAPVPPGPHLPPGSGGGHSEPPALPGVRAAPGPLSPV